MFIINCPYCGERDQQEFKAGGEAHIERPKQPTELSDDEWAEYLFMRKNIKGVQFERWNTHMVVENGLIWSETPLTMKLN